MRSIANDWEVARGSKAKAFLQVGSDPWSQLKLPLWIARGLADGPTVGVVAGVHGCEYPSIFAAVEFFEKLDASHLTRGTVVVVPVANPPGFATKTPFVCPIDGVNLNRVFPGSSSGTATYRIAAALFEEVLSKCDYVLDLHGGDYFERLLVHTKFFESGNQTVDEKSRQLARLFTERFYQPVLPPKAGGLFIETARAGIPSIIVEAGGEGLLDMASVQLHKRGIERTLTWLGMIKEGSAPLKTHTYEKVTGETALKASEGGFFLPCVSVGDRAHKGQALGEIRNLDAQVVDQFSSPHDDALIMLVNSSGVVSTGDTVYLVWSTVVEEERRGA
jgi:hypothetical protein